MKLDALSLPDNLYWQDEQSHRFFAQSKERSVSGALILDYQALQFGQPITLSGGWISRADLQQLQSLAATPAVKRQLTLNDGITHHTVLFDLEKGGIEAKLVRPATHPDDDTLYALTLHLITVQPDAEPT